jgi:DNA-binding NarL/FixJ family response regulator
MSIERASARTGFVSEKDEKGGGVTRVFILSSYPLFGQGIESLLAQEVGLEILGRETDLNQALERIKELMPDVVIVDCDDPGVSLTAPVISILKERLGIRVIGLSIQCNTVSIYRGEERLVQGVDDLVEAIEY